MIPTTTRVRRNRSMLNVKELFQVQHSQLLGQLSQDELTFWADMRDPIASPLDDSLSSQRLSTLFVSARGRLRIGAGNPGPRHLPRMPRLPRRQFAKPSRMLQEEGKEATRIVMKSGRMRCSGTFRPCPTLPGAQNNVCIGPDMMMHALLKRRTDLTIEGRAILSALTHGLRLVSCFSLCHNRSRQ